MNTLTDTNPARQPAIRTALLRDWLQAHPQLARCIEHRALLRFLQHILRTQKGGGEEASFMFFEHLLQRFTEEKIGFPAISNGLVHLREILLNAILEDRSALQEKHLNRLLALFDSFFSMAREKTLPKDPIKALGQGNAEKSEPMAFFVEEDRFGMLADINEAFQEWTGVDPEAFMGEPAWEKVIHAQDLPGLRKTLHYTIQNNRRFYRQVYRLRHHNGHWVSVCELGRIEYAGDNTPLSISALLIDQPRLALENGAYLGPQQILNHLIQEGDLMGILDESGVLLHASPALSNLLHTIRRQEEAVPFSVFLNWPTREAFARWHGEDHTRPLDIRLGTSPQELQSFSLYGLPAGDIFSPGSLLIWLKPRHLKDNGHFLQGINGLQKITRRIQKATDLPGFFQVLTQEGPQLIAPCDRVALLINTTGGLIFGTGQGFDPEVTKKRAILAPAEFAKLRRRYGPDGVSAGKFIIDYQPFANAILENLGLPPMAGEPDPAGSHHLIGLVKKNGSPRALLLFSREQHQEPFDDLSRELLSLMLQQASFSIGNLLLTHQLREAEVNYAAVYESSPLAILIIQDDVVKLFNRKYLELTGQTAERAHGDHFWTLLSEKDRSAIRDIFHRIEDRPEFLEREFQLEHAETGKVHCLGTFIQTLFSGKPAVLCEIKDITRLRNLEQQMLRAQRMEAIGNLAINVAHDFNNILGAIIPNAQLLLNETAQPELQKRAKAILYMARRAAKLTGRLLTYSDSEETGEKRINLNTLLKDGRAMFESLLGPAVSIHFDLNTALPDILGDPQHFMQILINLVANARDAMPEGGDLYIRTQPLNVLPGSEKAREIAAGEYVELCVRDTGLGVPEGLKRQIFRPFFTTKNPSDGSGLGLSIVSGLLKQHNGLITVESAETKGTTFRILMPVTQKPGAPAPVVAPPAARPPAKYIQGQGTILIVDDEKYLREVLVSMCKFLGFRCMEAGSGEEAIRLYEKNRDLIDYVILDFAMPGMNGKQTFDALKAIHQKLRVILCTGYADQRVINQLTRNEGVIYLPKPFTIELLDRKLRELTAKP